MSARGAKKGENRPSPDPRQKPAAPKPPADEDDAIEILEVVGMDEETGSVPKRRAGEASTEAPPAHAEGGPAAGHSALDRAVADKEKYYDLLLRKQAEFENFRKRTEREREELREGITSGIIKNLLPILDNLDRALATSEGSNDPLRQGLALIHQLFLETLKKEGVRPMDTLGARFDPRLHEAVQAIDVDGFEKGVILEEMQKGYTLKDRLLRPALVKVASGRRPPASGGKGASVDSE